jgi:hypothetical protein
MRSLDPGVFLVAVLAAIAGCNRGERAPVEREEYAEPQLVFEDDFERDALGERWSSEGGAWRLEGGALQVAGAHNDALWLDVVLPEKVRLEFDATAHSAEGDLKFEIFGDGATHESGYVGIFGGWSNRLNIIARLDEHGDDRLVGAEGVRVEPERTYRFRLERTDGRLRWWIDGEPFLTFDDSAPLRGADHAHFAFNCWEAPVSFDNVRVWNLDP